MLNGAVIIARRIQSIRFGPQCQRDVLLAASPASDEQCPLGDQERLFRVQADFLDNERRQTLHNFGADQKGMRSKKLPASGTVLIALA